MPFQVGFRDETFGFEGNRTQPGKRSQKTIERSTIFMGKSTMSMALDGHVQERIVSLPEGNFRQT